MLWIYSRSGVVWVKRSETQITPLLQTTYIYIYIYIYIVGEIAVKSPYRACPWSRSRPPFQEKLDESISLLHRVWKRLPDMGSKFHVLNKGYLKIKGIVVWLPECCLWGHCHDNCRRMNTRRAQNVGSVSLNVGFGQLHYHYYYYH